MFHHSKSFCLINQTNTSCRTYSSVFSIIKPFDIYDQGCTNPGCQAAQATKFCTVTPNIYGSRVKNVLHLTT